MEFLNEFRVPVDVDTAFTTLTDLRKVAPCLPGASLDEVEDDIYRGRVKVKVGPIQVSYRGTARLEADPTLKAGHIKAEGKEARGSGTARADVLANLVEDGDGTIVRVTTQLHLTGKPAQFGRGVMEDVGTRIMDTFATRLGEMLQSEVVGNGQAAVRQPVLTEVERAGDGGDEDALDLMEFAGPAAARRVLPLLGAVLAVVGLVWLLGRLRRRGVVAS